jgi:putative hemolysin
LDASDPEPLQQAVDLTSGILLQPLSSEVVILFIGMGLLLYLSALISGSEVAFFSLTPEHLNSLRSNSTRLNQRVLELLSAPKKLLATILIANNFINVSIIILSTFISTRLFSFDASPVLIFILQF